MYTEAWCEFCKYGYTKEIVNLTPRLEVFCNYVQCSCRRRRSDWSPRTNLFEALLNFVLLSSIPNGIIISMVARMICDYHCYYDGIKTTCICMIKYLCVCKRREYHTAKSSSGEEHILPVIRSQTIRYYKSCIINSYKSTCTIQRCYVCGNR